MAGEQDMSGWTDLLHSSTKLLEQAAPSAQFPPLQVFFYLRIVRAVFICVSNFFLKKKLKLFAIFVLQRNLDQLEALSKKLKAKTLRTEAPSQSIAATRFVCGIFIYLEFYRFFCMDFFEFINCELAGFLRGKV